MTQIAHLLPKQRVQGFAVLSPERKVPAEREGQVLSLMKPMQVCLALAIAQVTLTSFILGVLVGRGSW